MAQLRRQYPQFVALDTEVLVIGPEKADTFADHWRRHNYPFIGLPDPGHRVADLYGQEVKLLKLGRLPTLIVVDLYGRVRYQHHGRSMRDLPDHREILALLEKLNQEVQEAAPEGKGR